MKKVTQIVSIIDRESPGLLAHIAKEDSMTKEGLVRKVLTLSNSRAVRTHHLRGNSTTKT